jgi:drug/metabolite transporter (DMT)-like permease
MNAASILLLALAAIFHAVSQALIKGAKDSASFSWLLLGTTAVLGVPSLLLLDGVPPVAWAIVIASGIAEAAYFRTLSEAYSRGELSSVYPVARGSAPLFTLIWSAVFLGERPSAIGVGGIVVVVAGIYLSRLERLSDWSRPFRGFRGGTPWALATGLLISAYTTIDKTGVRYFEPIAYLYLVLAVAFVAQAPLMLGPRRRAAVAREIGRSGQGRWRPDARSCIRIVGATALAFAAYTLVLGALRLSPASYVATVRELSVVLGAWIGVRFMGEKGGALRIAGAVLVATGILAIALGG